MIASDTSDALNQITARGPGGWMRFRGTVDEPATVSVGGQPASVTAAGVFEGYAPVTPGNQTLKGIIGVTSLDMSRWLIDCGARIREGVGHGASAAD